MEFPSRYRPTDRSFSSTAPVSKKLPVSNVETCQETSTVIAPPTRRVLNHAWSNHPDYVVSASKDFGNNLFVHHLPTGDTTQITKTADADLPDLWVAP